jgi:hypothetical protein
MCNRQKPITRQEIEDIKVQLNERKLSLERLMCKLDTSGWTPDDIALANEHQRWIAANAPIVKAYYQPATR